MLEWEPWIVRHLYTTVDRRFDPYLSAMKDLLGRAQETQRISTVHNRPIGTKDDIALALKEPEPGELVIVGLHGAADEDGAWLGPHCEQPFFNLREVPAAAWSATTVVLTNCEGAQDQFEKELRRINTRPFVLVGHFEIAQMRDHTPMAVVNKMLHDADGGDEAATFRAPRCPERQHPGVGRRVLRVLTDQPPRRQHARDASSNTRMRRPTGAVDHRGAEPRARRTQERRRRAGRPMAAAG